MFDLSNGLMNHQILATQANTNNIQPKKLHCKVIVFSSHYH
jgi:hypothetical protein